jgi:hypothetical protein
LNASISLALRIGVSTKPKGRQRDSEERKTDLVKKGVSGGSSKAKHPMKHSANRAGIRNFGKTRSAVYGEISSIGGRDKASEVPSFIYKRTLAKASGIGGGVVTDAGSTGIGGGVTNCTDVGPLRSSRPRG